MNEAITSYMKKLSAILSEKRYNHSVGVMNTAIELAKTHNADEEKAAIAGILHDCAKYMKSEELYNYCIDNDIALTEAETKAKQLIHSRLGMTFARDIYGVEDEEILSAILYHTTGRDNMTKLEQIIFVADYIEPNRKYLDGLEYIREVSYKDLNRACALILEKTINYLENDTDNYIDPMSLKAYDYYKQYLDQI